MNGALTQHNHTIGLATMFTLRPCPDCGAQIAHCTSPGCPRVDPGHVCEPRIVAHNRT